MESIGAAVRRMMLLVMLAAGIGGALAWRQRQASTPTPTAAPAWPPLALREPDPEPTAAPKPGAASEPAGAWVTADGDGTAPETHPVKAKDSSGIFHLPGGRFYDRTKPDRCYPTAAAAEADGYRQSKT